MAKFINIHELRSDKGIASLMRRAPRRARPLGGNFEEPFAEDGEDDGFSEPAAAAAPAVEPEAEEQPAPSQEDITWIKSRVSTDSIRSAKALVSGGLAKGMIVLKNETQIKTRETFEELCALMDAP